MNREAIGAWLARYEHSWRSAGTDHLIDLFTPDATYSPGPFEPTRQGIAEIAALWESEREGPDERFTMRSEIVACERAVGVTRIEVNYDDTGAVYRDLWIIELELDGRCSRFEEWPTWPEGQQDG